MFNTETILRWKGFPVKDAADRLNSFYNQDRVDQVKWIEQQKKSTVEFHFKNNSFYANLLANKLPAVWNEIPILQKSDFQFPLERMLSHGYQLRNVYVSNTSGSSGHPFFFAKDKFSHAITWAYILRQYKSLNLNQGDWQARFYGIPLDKISFLKEKVKDLFMHRIRFPVFDLGDTMLLSFLDKFRKSKIDYVYGYTNSILLFSEFLLNNNICLIEDCPSLKCCIVTSEVCRDEDKKVIEQAMGVPVIREYGASELDVIAIEDQNGRWSVNESNLLIEVLDENNQPIKFGDEGRLVITSLYNKAMPFIRYDIGDIGVLEEDEHGIYLKKLAGRVNDTILLPSGRKSPGLTFYYVSRSILESSGILKEFIIRQTALDQFEFDIVSDRPLSLSEENDIRKKMDTYLEPGLRLNINRVKKIKRPSSGKIKHFYSELTV